MTSEREHILEDLQSRLWAITGVKLVERNLRKIATLSTFPAVFIVEGDDSVAQSSRRGVYDRRLQVGVACFVKGTSEDLAIQELSSFLISVKQAIYSGGHRLGDPSTGVGAVKETRTGAVLYPDIANHVLAQVIELEISYLESLSA